MSDGIIAGEVVASRYVLRQRLGQGGQASVWLAEDRQTRTEVALKIARARVRDNSGSMARLAREAQLLARLEHPHIARCLDFDMDGERPYLAMELVRGVSLSRELRKRAQNTTHFELGEVHELFSQLLDALAYAHGEGVVHRDLKPDNIMFVRTSSGIATKLLDLGVAKLLGEDAHAETTQGRVLGSVMYMSPEQASGARVDARSDIFALGIILFEVLTLRRAWAQSDDGTPLLAYASRVTLNARNAPTEILSRMIAPERPKPSRWRAGLPAELDAVVARALAVQSEARIEDAAGLAEAIEMALGEGQVRTRLTVLAETARELGSDSAGDLAVAMIAQQSDELARARLPVGLAEAPIYGATVTAPGSSLGASQIADTTRGSDTGTGSAEVRLPRRSPLPLALGATLALALGALATIFTIARRQEPELIRTEPTAATAVTPRVEATVLEASKAPAQPIEPEVATATVNPPLAPARRARAPTPTRRAPSSVRPEPTPREREDKAGLSRLSAQLESLRKDPSNLALFNRTGQAIMEAAETRVRSRAKRDRINRLATTSMRVADLNQLERAFAELRSAVD